MAKRRFKLASSGRLVPMAYTQGPTFGLHGAGPSGSGAELRALAILGPGWRVRFGERSRSIYILDFSTVQLYT